MVWLYFSLFNHLPIEEHLSFFSHFLTITDRDAVDICVPFFVRTCVLWDKCRMVCVAFFFFFWLRCATCGILVPQSGIEPVPPALGAWSLNHLTAREIPVLLPPPHLIDWLIDWLVDWLYWVLVAARGTFVKACGIFFVVVAHGLFVAAWECLSSYGVRVFSL